MAEINESQKIVFRMAMGELESVRPRLDKVVGAALGLNRNQDGSRNEDSEYSDWAKDSDKAKQALIEAVRLFKIILSELNI